MNYSYIDPPNIAIQYPYKVVVHLGSTLDTNAHHKNKIRDWLKESELAYVEPNIFSFRRFHMCFKTEEDALIYKLVWGGDIEQYDPK